MGLKNFEIGKLENGKYEIRQFEIGKFEIVTFWDWKILRLENLRLKKNKRKIKISNWKRAFFTRSKSYFLKISQKSPKDFPKKKLPGLSPVARNK